ncbi:hypothetical protein MLD38_000553 [Melastoma candidum]|uniref:Uncharacterized protein n=1 Tax=Melastoma candidum TaxID=119954 RepID=A0ACB9S9Z3_9MYRT|nr:hypothetical protein MLD38_000553 [Melastoma candidum]
MDKLNKSHVLILALLAALLLVTPLLSSNLRPTYLYFITNILIISLGAEAGLLSFFSNSPHSKRLPSNNNAGTKNPSSYQPSYPATSLYINQSPTTYTGVGATPASSYDAVTLEKTENRRDSVRVVEKCLSEKVGLINAGGMKENKFKRCPSMPSLFFIGGAPEAETEDGDRESDFASDREDEPVDEAIISGQELFAKAETFIGNFYKQLKMQREESWKRIHGFYQKAF